jgi:hypothetical protein
MRLWPIPYAFYILAATPPTASVLRYALMVGPAWWPAPTWSRDSTSTVRRVVVVSGLILLGLALQWWWLRTYFVIDPYSRGHP